MSELDALTTEGGITDGEGKIDPVRTVQPHKSEVRGNDVLDLVSAGIRKHIVLPKSACDVIALWCAGTFLMDNWRVFPRLNIQSPEKGCGKSNLLTCIGDSVERPLLAENMTTAVMFRVTDQYSPTLLLDEVDGWLKENEELRSMVNSGYQRGSLVWRCVGNDNEIGHFKAYAAMVLAGIGNPPPTILDRSIVIRLERASRSETHQEINEGTKLALVSNAQMLARWTSDNTGKINASLPSLPKGLFNRPADLWRPLFKIAAVAGGDWPSRVVKGYECLIRHKMEDEDKHLMMLRDSRAIFDNGSLVFVRPDDFAEYLHKLDDSPWSEYNGREGPITKHQVSRLLKRYALATRTHKVSSHPNSIRVWHRDDFARVWPKYLPPPDSSCHLVTTTENKGDNQLLEVVTATPNDNLENNVLPNKHGHCDKVTTSQGGSGENLTSVTI